ncbi:MAG: hypothetical protein MUC88_20700 [Planctomycetes bacterium]|jgi:hypothetical protein|nr:hypothetical protein [Planctomycetota bacterium]
MSRARRMKRKLLKLWIKTVKYHVIELSELKMPFFDMLKEDANAQGT